MNGSPPRRAVATGRQILVSPTAWRRRQGEAGPGSLERGGAICAPGARVIKAFNHLAPHVLSAEPRVGGGRRVLFYSGDDAEAKEVFAAFVGRLGFQGIDLGGLAAGGALHQFPGGPLPVRDLIQL